MEYAVYVPRKKEAPEDDSPVVSVRVPAEVKDELKTIGGATDRPYTRVAWLLLRRGLEAFRVDGVLVREEDSIYQAGPRFTGIEEAKADGREVNEELKKALAAFKGKLELRDSDIGEEVTLPLLGRVAAGPGGLVPFEFIEKIQVSQHWYRRGARYVLRASGNSMVDAGIFDGFVVYVKPIKNGEKVPNGSTVIALLDGNAMVKQYENLRGRVRLVSRNDVFGYPAVEVKDGQELLIQGIVVGTAGDL